MEDHALSIRHITPDNDKTPSIINSLDLKSEGKLHVYKMLPKRGKLYTVLTCMFFCFQFIPRDVLKRIYLFVFLLILHK